MAFKNTAVTKVIVAWDTVNNVYKTGDSANITTRGVGDGSEFTPAAPNVTEIDSTNLPGRYSVALAAGENNYHTVTLGGKSSTSGIAIFGPQWDNEMNANVAQLLGTAWLTPGVAGTPDVNVKSINAVSTSSVTAVNANQGTTGVVTFTVATQVDCNVKDWAGTAVSAPATAGIPEVNIKNVNNVSASSVTAVNANQGTTQPINFTGTAGSALVKGDMVDVAGAAVSTTTAQLGVNAVKYNNQTAATDANNLPKVALVDIIDTALTETVAGYLAGSFKKLFDVTSPTAQADKLPLNTDYTSARATKLDNLDAAISTRSTLTQAQVISDATPFPGADIDAAVSSRAPSATALSTANWTNARAAFLDNLNVLKIKKNTALANFGFLMVLSADHITPATGLTVAVQRSIDGGAFGNATNSPATEIASGCYKISLSAADMNGDIIILKMTSATADQRTIIIATEP